jgi:hypothetical protein
MAEGVVDKIMAILDRFNPKTFSSQDEANNYVRSLANKNRQTYKPDIDSFLKNYAKVNGDLRAGKPNKTVDEMRRLMQPLPDDVIVTRTGPPGIVGLDPANVGNAEELTGKLVRDKGFWAANIGGPLPHQDGNITFTMAVPKGTKALAPSTSKPNGELIFEPEQPFRITEVNPDGKGGFFVYAVAAGDSEAPEAIDIGKAVPEAGVPEAPAAAPQAPAAPGGAAPGTGDLGAPLSRKPGRPAGPAPEPRNDGHVADNVGGGGQAPGSPSAPVTQGEPAPELPPAPEAGTDARNTFREAFDKADLKVPTVGTRRKQFMDGYNGVASGKKTPQEAVNDLDNAISANKKIIETDKADGTDSGPLPEDVKRLEALRDLIAEHFNFTGRKKFKESSGETKAPSAPKAAPAPVAKAAEAPAAGSGLKAVFRDTDVGPARPEVNQISRELGLKKITTGEADARLGRLQKEHQSLQADAEDADNTAKANRHADAVDGIQQIRDALGADREGRQAKAVKAAEPKKERPRLNGRGQVIRPRAPKKEPEPEKPKAPEPEAPKKAAPERLIPGMAAGKTNAGRVKVGERILVTQNKDGTWSSSPTKSKNATAITVTGKSAATGGGRSRTIIHGEDDGGNKIDVRSAPSHQTFWVAPEKGGKKEAPAAPKKSTEEIDADIAKKERDRKAQIRREMRAEREARGETPAKAEPAKLTPEQEAKLEADRKVEAARTETIRKSLERSSEPKKAVPPPARPSIPAKELSDKGLMQRFEAEIKKDNPDEARLKELGDELDRRDLETKNRVQGLTDDDLEKKFQDEIRKDNPDEEEMRRLGDELDRRDKERADKERKIEALVAKGRDYRDAWAEVNGKDPKQLDLEERNALLDQSRRAGESRETTLRRLYQEHVHRQYLDAERETRGHLLTPEGRSKGIDPKSLFQGSNVNANRYASDELKEYWDKNPRKTFLQYKADTLGREKDVEGAKKTEGIARNLELGERLTRKPSAKKALPAPPKEEKAPEAPAAPQALIPEPEKTGLPEISSLDEARAQLNKSTIANLRKAAEDQGIDVPKSARLKKDVVEAIIRGLAQKELDRRGGGKPQVNAPEAPNAPQGKPEWGTLKSLGVKNGDTVTLYGHDRRGAKTEGVTGKVKTENGWQTLVDEDGKKIFDIGGGASRYWVSKPQTETPEAPKRIGAPGTKGLLQMTIPEMRRHAEENQIQIPRALKLKKEITDWLADALVAKERGEEPIHVPTQREIRQANVRARERLKAMDREDRLDARIKAREETRQEERRKAILLENRWSEATGKPAIVGFKSTLREKDESEWTALERFDIETSRQAGWDRIRKTVDRDYIVSGHDKGVLQNNLVADIAEARRESTVPDPEWDKLEESAHTGNIEEIRAIISNGVNANETRRKMSVRDLEDEIKAGKAKPSVPTDLNKASVPQLREIADSEGIHVPKSLKTKDDLVAHIEWERTFKRPETPPGVNGRVELFTLNPAESKQNPLKRELGARLDFKSGNNWPEAKRNRIAQTLNDYMAEEGSASPWRLRTPGPEEQAFIRDIDEAMDQSPLGQDLDLWRGIQDASAIFTPEQLKGSLKGTSFNDKGFASTSPDRAVSERFAESGPRDGVLARLHVPKGTKGIHLADEDQDEVLLERGLKFDITGDTGPGSKPRILDVSVSKAPDDAPETPKAVRQASGKAPTLPGTPERYADIGGRLKAAQSREEANQILADEKLTVPQLKVLADSLNIAVRGNKAAILADLVHWTTGRRLDSAAVSRPSDTGSELRRITGARTPGNLQVSTKPILPNNWGTGSGEIEFHGDGHLGRALATLGNEGHLEVPGENDNVTNVIGRLATDAMRGKITQKELISRVQAVRDKMSASAPVRVALDRALKDMDTPEVKLPDLPEGTPTPIHKLMKDLSTVPLARKDRIGHPDSNELTRLATLMDEWSKGRLTPTRFLEELRRNLLNNRHESEEGKFEIDRMVMDAIKNLETILRTDRKSLYPPHMRS